MRIGIFVSPEEQAGAKHLLRTLRAASMDAAAYQIRDNWDTLDAEQLRLNFGTISHMLIACERDSAAAAWVPLLVGYALGKNCSLALYVDEGSRRGRVPPYLQGFHLLSDIESLVSYYRDEKACWEQSSRVQEAEARLRDRGHGLSDDVLADCAIAGDIASVTDFLTVGFTPDTKDRRGVPLLCLAIRAHQREVVSLLIERGANVSMMSDDRGNTPLMEAAVRGDTETVERLLRHGADVNLQSKNGQTALMLAVGEGFTDAVRLLLENGADITPVDQLGMTARKYAELFKHNDICALLEGV